MSSTDGKNNSVVRAAKRWAKKRYEAARTRHQSPSVVTAPKVQRTLNRAQTRDLYRRNGIPLSTRRRRHSPSKWKSHQTLEQRWLAAALADYAAEQLAGPKHGDD